MAAYSPFDFLNAINVTKENLFEDPQAQKDYTPFMVNRGLSYFYDTVHHANMMNIHSDIPKTWQFSYLINTIAKKKRFSKWSKADKTSESIDLVMRYYGYNIDKARVALKMLSKEQLKSIKDSFDTGGKR
jgi:hypothetical protein